MSDDCIFCAIVAGDVPSRTVYEDDDVFAFLDANPLAPGHTLVIPKEHHERVNDLPADVAGDLFSVVPAITDAVEGAVDAHATTVAVNNGELAGQEVDHVHAHVVPRFESDGGRPIHALFRDRPDLSDDELDGICEDVAANVD